MGDVLGRGVSPEARVMVVGELNPYGSDPSMALFFLPRTASGNRLRMILGLSDLAYCRDLQKANLCRGRWSVLAARDEARRLLDLSTATVYLLCGARVRESFGGPRFYEAERRGSKFLLSLPHPSGLNRMWNDPKARRRVRAACRAVAPWVAWGGYDEL